MGLSQLEICNQALLKVGADTIDTLTEPASTADGTKRSIQLCNIFFDQAYDEVLRMYPWNSAKKRTVCSLSKINNYPDTITATGAVPSGANGEWVYLDMYNDRPRYNHIDELRELSWQGTYWLMSDEFGGTMWEHRNFTDSYLPPKGGWVTNNPSEGNLPPSLAYDLLFGYERYSALPSDMIRLVDCFQNENQRDERTAWVVEGGYILSDYDTLYIKYVAKPSDTTKLDPLCTNALICNLAMKLATSLQLDDDWAKRINDELYGIILPGARSIDTQENKELLLEESSWVFNRHYTSPIV